MIVNTSAGLSPQRSLSILFLSRVMRHSPAQRWCNFQPMLASCSKEIIREKNLHEINFEASQMQEEPEVYKGRKREVLLKRLQSLLRRLVRQLFQASQCLHIEYVHFLCAATLATTFSVVQSSKNYPPVDLDLTQEGCRRGETP